MWKKKQNSLKENTHLHSETKTKLQQQVEGENTKNPKTPDRKKQGTQNENGSSG